MILGPTVILYQYHPSSLVEEDRSRRLVENHLTSLIGLDLFVMPGTCH